jgi:hypothetical protein
MLVATLVLVPGLLYPAAVSPAAGQADAPPSPPTPQRTAWEIGAEIYSFKYEESIMEEEGLFLGFNLGCTSRPWLAESQTEGGVMFGLEGRFAFGQVDYDGALLDGTPYTVDNVDDYTLEARAILGADQLSSAAMHTIYTGLGYRYLNDDLSSDPAGYERESNSGSSTISSSGASKGAT